MSSLARPLDIPLGTGDDILENENENENEFTRLVEENQHRVVSIARGVLGNQEDAEEIAQDAFLRAFHRFASLREAEKFRPWIHQIVFRLALNRRRARRRGRERDTAWHRDRTEPPRRRTGAALDKLLLDDVRAEIEALPEKLRLVLVFCAIEGMDAPEVAEILGVPVGTVRSRLHLARKRLLSKIPRGR